MSYLETGSGRFTWIAATAPTASIRPEAGCVQCGSRLDSADTGIISLTGKCYNCISWISDEDEAFDDFED
jgi:hypothetical protein